MANQPEQAVYDAGVYQIESTDPVDGGVGAKTNAPLLNLANRTAWLKGQVDALNGGSGVFATKESPSFTGTPTAPTQAVGDSSTKLANDAFVHRAVNGSVSVNIAGNANVTLVQAQWGFPILVLTGAITADIAVIFPTQSGRWQVINSATGAFSVTLKTAAGTGVKVTAGTSTNVFCDGTNIALQQTDFISPALTGSPTAPTANPLDSSQLLANTSFVKASGLTFRGIFTFNASTTLTSAHVGGLVIITGVGGLSFTLPAANSVRAGDTIGLRSNTSAAATNTVRTTGGDVLGGAFGAGSTVTSIRGNDCVVLVSDGSSRWELAVDASAALIAQQFSYQQSFGANGYQKHPGGMVLVWGEGSTNSGGTAAVSFPAAFPNACRQIVASASNVSGSAQNYIITTGPMSTTGLTIYASGATAGSTPSAAVVGFRYIAVGN